MESNFQHKKPPSGKKKEYRPAVYKRGWSWKRHVSGRSYRPVRVYMYVARDTHTGRFKTTKHLRGVRTGQTNKKFSLK